MSDNKDKFPKKFKDKYDKLCCKLTPKGWEETFAKNKKKFKKEIVDNKISCEAHYIKDYFEHKNEIKEKNLPKSKTLLNTVKQDYTKILNRVYRVYQDEISYKLINENFSILSEILFKGSLIKCWLDFLGHCDRNNFYEFAVFEYDEKKLKKEIKSIKLFLLSLYRIKAVEGEDVWLDPKNMTQIPLVGREHEQEKLDEFIKDDDKFKIWAIVGPSGSGKTRLVFEWANTSNSLEDWHCLFLSHDARLNPSAWQNWSPKQPTLIIIDFLFGFDEVLKNLVTRCKAELPYLTPLPHKVRLLIIDHVFTIPLQNDKRWGLSDSVSYDLNNTLFFDDTPLNLSKTQEQDLITTEIIAHRAGLESDDLELEKASNYLKQMIGAWHPLFAALLGDTIRNKKSYETWDRRELIKYFLDQDRLSWDEDNSIEQWTACLVSISTARRGVQFENLLNTLSPGNACPHPPNTIINRCKKFIPIGNKHELKPYEPDLLGESFFLIWLQKLMNLPNLTHSENIKHAFFQMFCAGDKKVLENDTYEFIGFIQQVTRNLLNEDQSLTQTTLFWEALFLFLQPVNFPKHSIIRWAVSIALINIAWQINKETHTNKKHLRLLQQVEEENLYQTDSPKLFETYIYKSILFFELKSGEKQFGKNQYWQLFDIYEIEFFEHFNVLAYACEKGYFEVVKFLVYHGYDVNKKEDYVDSALTIATYNGHSEIVEFLLSINVKVFDDENEIDNRNALFSSCINGNMGILNLFVKSDKASIHCTNDSNYMTALMYASENGHTEIVKRLIDLKANTQNRNKNGDTAFTLACMYGHLSIVELLIKQEPNIDYENCDKETAFMLACQHGHLHIAKFLIQFKPVVDHINCHGDTALLQACKSGHQNIVEYLVTKEANINVRNSKYETPLIIASHNGHQSIVEYLLTKKPNVNDPDCDGNNALMYACLHGHLEITKLLIKHGANVHAQNNNRQTALMKSSLTGYRNIVELLVKGYEANIYKEDNVGLTALKYSLLNGEESVFKFLVDNGEELSQKDEFGNNLLMLMCSSGYFFSEGHKKILQFLIKKGPDINDKNDNDETALNIICNSNKGDYTGLKIVMLLVENGANILNQNSNHIISITAAYQNRYFGVVDFLIKQCQNIPKMHWIGDSALINACQGGHAHLCKFIVCSDVLHKIKKETIETSFQVACKNNHVDILGLLMKHMDNKIQINNALIKACRQGKVDVVKFLIEQGVDICDIDSKTSTALDMAVLEGHIGIVKLILNHVSNKEEKISITSAALLPACSSGLTDIAQYLIEQGANPNQKDFYDYSALTLACIYGHFYIVVLLINHQVKINNKGNHNHTALMEAYFSEQITIAKFLIKNGADTNIQNDDGFTALIWACQSGKEKIVEFLLNYHVDPNIQDNEGFTALMWACHQGYKDIVKYLLKHDAKTNVRNNYDESALICASNEGHWSIVELLIKVGVSIKNGDGQYILLEASAKGQKAVVELLIEGQVNVNSYDKNKDTAIWLAEQNQHQHIVDFLSKNGANIEEFQEKKLGESLIGACVNKDIPKIKLLIGQGADVNYEKDGFNPLKWACMQGLEEAVELFVASGANPNLIFKDETTPLMNTCKDGLVNDFHLGHLKTIEFLIENGANVNGTNDKGYTALMYACWNSGFTKAHDRIAMTDLLVKLGANVNCKNQNGYTPLMLASENGYTATALLLVNHGAKVLERNNNGYTAIALAKKNGHLDIICLLINHMTKSW